jgi:hypothetical protein
MQVTRIKHPATLIASERISEIGRCDGEVLNSAKKLVLREAILDYKPNALEIVDIGFGGIGQGHIEFTGDGKQVYAQALAYLLTKNEKYAETVMKILDAWASRCVVFKGPNAPLEAAWGTASMTRGCELMKYAYPKWNRGIEEKYKAWVKRMLMPHLNGDTEKYHLKWGFYNNWHTSIMEAKLQYALLCDDIKEVNKTIVKYKEIFDDYVRTDGMTGESNRDSDHCCFGIAGMIQTCELLNNQGVDLYSYKGHLLKKCVEFHAQVYSNKYDTNKTAEFHVYKWIQPSGWEVIRHYYQNDMPYTDMLLKRIRPCNYALHWGFDTLTHARK